MTFCAGGIVLGSTQKPAGKSVDDVGGAGGVDTGGVGVGGVGAGGVGAGGVGAGGVGAGELVGGAVANAVLTPLPQPPRSIPGASNKKIAVLDKRVIQSLVKPERDAKATFAPVKLNSFVILICISSATVQTDARYDNRTSVDARTCS
jgi:hypothetical protein